ncbi:hypothetical protein E8D34_06790 [Nocardioides sp. GY 10113]|uniref:hypothetical protein n=1 Tax=Nocardioides sp. GY 10113 TaxID=2569761 RepID=UPI0010A77972|nr:hypothetical protein [Nocardioides sp. GY 10113]TIC87993.1 hypothetical protein E8D34_06790 [Nocardioides sp. GY 10113]
MRSKFALVAVALALTAMSVGPASAGRGPGSVEIERIPTQVAPYHGKSVVRPQAYAYGNSEIAWKRLTVTRNGHTLVRNARSSRLAPGRYRVSTKVRFRTWRLVDQTLRVPAGTVIKKSGGSLEPRLDGCRVDSVEDTAASSGALVLRCVVWAWNPVTKSELKFSKVRVPGEFRPAELAPDFTEVLYRGTYVGFADTPADLVDAEMFVNSITLPHEITATRQVRRYRAWVTKTRAQRLVVKRGPKPRTCATYADFKSVDIDFDNPRRFGDSRAEVASKLHSAGEQSSFSDDGEGQIITFRRYRTCDSGSLLSVGFVNGYAYAKHYHS